MSSTILQPVTSSVPVSVNNILTLIQLCCLCCVCQIVCFVNTCNVINVYWCDYCCLLNKFCCLISSMQDVKKLLILKRFCSTSMLLSIAFCASTVASTTKLWPKVTATAILCFVMQCRESSLVSFKFIKLLL